jgi:hypothetical protein
MATRGGMAIIDTQADFFFGFFFSRFGASLFPMHPVSHIRAHLTTPVDLKLLRRFSLTLLRSAR